MTTPVRRSSLVVLPSVYNLILASPRLKQMLLPGGLVTSPYESLDCQATLILEDPKGLRATFRRTQQIRFLQDRVSAILDHFWGDGVAITHYHNDAGRLEDSFRERGQRHLVIGLKREMRRGETLGFEVSRTGMVGFTKDEEWLETSIDQPVEQLTRNIVFPKERPCQRAMLHSAGADIPLPIIKMANGKTLVHFKIQEPGIGSSYTVRWAW